MIIYTQVCGSNSRSVQVSKSAFIEYIPGCVSFYSVFATLCLRREVKMGRAWHCVVSLTSVISVEMDTLGQSIVPFSLFMTLWVCVW